MKTLVHYTEHLVFHRLIRPDDELTVKGKIAAIFPHRAGTQIISRFDAIDKSNLPVFTEHVGGMLRGVKCVGEGRGEDSLPEVPMNKDNSKPLWKKSIAIERLQPFIYDGCTNIFFPIHTSKKFAHFVGLPDIILQGTATLAFAVRELINEEAHGNPYNVKEISCKFSDMVMPGTTIEIQLNKRKKVENGAELYFEVYNSTNKKAISNGYVLMKNLLH